MLPAKARNFTLTFVCYVFLALVLTDVVQAKTHAQVVRRDHSDVNRMIRKRGPVERGLFAIGAASDPPSAPLFGAPVSSTTSQPPVFGISSSTDSSSTTSMPGFSLGFGSLLNPSTSSSSLSSSSSSSSSSLSSSSASTSSSSSSIPSSTSSTPPSTSSAVLPVTSPSQSIQYETVTSTNSVASSTSSAQVTSNVTSNSRTAITVIIAIAACVGGIAIIWTLIRKWKFRPSAQFEDRMQPIDFQPTHDEHIAGLHRTTSNASSFHSSSAQSDENIARPDISHLKPLPEHDFTAGPAHLAPVGGYADLARGPSPGPYRGPSPGPGLYRGPSPQPQMQEALHRGPSIGAPSYDQYAVPLHHQGGYGTMNGARY